MVRDPSIVSPSLTGVFIGGGHNKHGAGSRCTLPKQCRGPPSPRRRWRCDRSSYEWRAIPLAGWLSGFEPSHIGCRGVPRGGCGGGKPSLPGAACSALGGSGGAPRVALSGRGSSFPLPPPRRETHGSGLGGSRGVPVLVPVRASPVPSVVRGVLKFFPRFPACFFFLASALVGHVAPCGSLSPWRPYLTPQPSRFRRQQC